MRKIRFQAKTLFGALLALAGMLALAGCATDTSHGAAASDLVRVGGDNSYCTPLLAGQSTNVGEACLSVDNDTNELVIQISTTTGFTQVHVAAGTSSAAIPTNKSGNPVPGQFPYTGTIAGNTAVVRIPLAVFGLSSDMTVCTVPAYLAIHLAMSNGETAWAAGTRFVARGNWATYFSITLNCYEGVPPPPPAITEDTAWAKGDPSACFGDYGFNNWGWTNGPFEPGTYTAALWAGAGPCDTSKGTLVGTVTLSYTDSGTATVTYATTGEFYLNATHLYVGKAPFATNNRGEYTVAPGQLPYKHTLREAQRSDTFTITNLSGPVYFTAHADVSGPFAP